MGRWGDGEVGRWGDGVMGRRFNSLFDNSIIQRLVIVLRLIKIPIYSSGLLA
ncbi:hypothetical protein [Moorena producens]|uniref:hypothetical protein n=1 Tax=Moorena producens TaxID=1155739 RepID=UPI003C715E23